MKWVIDFYNRRRAIVARYEVEAPSPAAAVERGRQTMLVQYPPVPARGRLSLFERAERIGGQDETGWIVYRIAKGALVLLFATVILGGSTLAHADVPKPQDIAACNHAACNHEAQEATRKGNDSRDASPNARDHSRAADARRGTASSANPGGDPRSSDPQLDGMDPDGAKDPAYQAAYRTCMRKAGF